jgi:hypothetical protein
MFSTVNLTFKMPSLYCLHNRFKTAVNLNTNIDTERRVKLLHNTKNLKNANTTSRI